MNPTRLLRCAAVVAAAALVGGCGAFNNDTEGETIRYEVTTDTTSPKLVSTRALSISYATTQGRQEQTDVGLPWTKKTIGGRGFRASVTAQYAGAGTIACRIVVGRKVIAEQTAVGPYPEVECRSP